MSEENSSPQIMMGKIPLRTTTEVEKRIAMMLWGVGGCGKTTLAGTAPGKKLWILFDRQGAASLSGRDDILVADLSGERYNITTSFMDDNPFNLEKVIVDNDIDTVVFDSVTAYATLCLEAAVAALPKSSHEAPSLQGYGYRNARVLRALVALNRLTARLKKHFIIIAHEDQPVTDDDGLVKFISVQLGGKMTNTLSGQLSEIWYLEDTGKEHRIAIRPCRKRLPMKTRMFDATNKFEFTWKYDPSTQTGDGINNWFNDWSTSSNGKAKIPS